MSEWMVQGLGFVAVIFFIVSYQVRSNKGLFLCQLIGCLIIAVQMILLGAYTGALGLAVNILRNLLLLKVDTWKWVGSRKTLAGIIALLVVITALTWDGMISLLPFFSVGISTIGYWTNNAQKIRLGQLCGSPFTLVYDILVHTWGGALCEAIALASILISIARFGWTKLGEGQPV